MSADSLRAAEQATAGVSSSPVDSAVQPCPLAKALEVLFLGEDNKPVSGVGLQLRDGGQAMLSRTGPYGVARFDGLTGSGYQLCPYELDKEAWNTIRTEPLVGARALSQAAATWGAPVPDLPESSGITKTIEQGEMLDSVALAHGLFPATVWDHSQNSDLKSKRESGNVLLAGDRLFVPPLRREETAVNVATRTILRRLGVPSRLRIRLFDDLQPLALTAWSLEIEGEATRTGKTDAEGILEAWVPATATLATVTFIAGNVQRSVAISLGMLVPAHEGAGWRQRLHNLGFDCVLDGGSGLSVEDRGAIRRFQVSYGLPLTGEPDAATLEKLYVVHDGAASDSPPDGLYASGA